MIWLTLARHHAVKSDEVLATVFPVLGILSVNGQRAFVLTFIIMNEDGWDINAVRTGHTVFAVVAGNGLHLDQMPGHLVEEGGFFLADRLQRTVVQEVVFQVFHIGHTAEHRQHTIWCSCITESPGGDAMIRIALFHLLDDILRNIRKSAAQQRFHDDGWNMPLLQFAIQITGIGIAFMISLA